MDLALSAGLHKICVQFFQFQDGDGLKVEWKPAGKVKSEIDKSLLLQIHKTIAKSLNPTYKIN